MGFFSGINFGDLAASAGQSLFSGTPITAQSLLTPNGPISSDAKAAIAAPPRNGTPVAAPSSDAGVRSTWSVSDFLKKPYGMAAVAAVVVIGLYFALKK